MSLDLPLLGSKLSRYRKQFQASIADVEAGTGIPAAVLSAYENGQREPTGDHILIISDYYKCDYKFFISSEKLAPFEQTETLFRMHGDDLLAEDRWSIQEFLFLCECEEYLLSIAPLGSRRRFSFAKRGSHYKKHGIEAAVALRRHLGYEPHEACMDIFGDMRAIGLHIFRRQLTNSAISGLFIRHPQAGACVLVNYSEDMYRQRFTAAHEAGHAVLDDGNDVNISFRTWDKNNFSEVRANTFASHYLMPPEFLRGIPESHRTSVDKLVDWASRLKVSTIALSYALSDAALISEDVAEQLSNVAVPSAAKVDAELSVTLSPAGRTRKLDMLTRGLSDFYVSLCFQAYRESTISSGRLAEMLLVPPQEVHSVAALYREALAHGD